MLELTDGWYSISCCLAENPLRTYVKDESKIIVGTKLITFGAEIMNLSQPCSPLEAPSFESLMKEYEAYLDTTKNNIESKQGGNAGSV